MAEPGATRDPAGPSGRTAGRRRRPAAAALAVAAALAAGVGSFAALAPTAPVGRDAPTDRFSAGRAMVHLEELGPEPRTIGSPSHAAARQYLVDTLTGFGWDVQVQQAVGSTDWGSAGTQRFAEVANVVATLPGTDPTGTVLLAAHYDTVAGSPGAADDGIGVATVLETARALADDADPPRNDVVVLVTDAEEAGLIGAEAFVREHADDLGSTVVLNHEARGTTGPPMTYRMTEPNEVLLDAVARAPGVLVDSGSEATAEALPNDTDFRHFRDAGFHGLDTALVAGGAYYHSPLDDPDRLSGASLQQMGDSALALARTVRDVDLATVADGGEQLATSLPWGVLRYPAPLDVPLAAGSLVLALALTGLARRQREVTVPRVALAVLVALGCLLAGTVAGFAVWQVALVVDPAQVSAVVGEPYRPGPYRVAILLAAAAVTAGLLAVSRRRLGMRAVTSGSLLVVAVVGVLLALAVPGASMTFVLPLLPTLVALAVVALLPPRWSAVGVIASVAAMLWSAVVLGPATWIGLDIGLGLGGPVAAVLLVVLALLALPLADVVWPVPRERRGWSRRSALALVAALVLVAAVTGAGLVLNREGATDPRQESVMYALDADSEQGHWLSWQTPPSGWSRSLLSDGVGTVDEVAPWADGGSMAHGPAPAADLPGPEVEVLADEDVDGDRRLTLRVTSQRGAPTVGLWVSAETATVREATVAGRDVALHGPFGRWDVGVQHTAQGTDGVEVILLLEQHGSAVEVLVVDRTEDLSDAPELRPPSGRVLVGPAVHVSRVVTL